VAEEEPILDEALDNLKESAQRIRATQNRLRASGLADHPNYAELSYGLSAALAMTEARRSWKPAAGRNWVRAASKACGCLGSITRNTLTYHCDNAGSEPQLELIDGHAKVPMQLRVEHK
jgi:hypothetical protein